MTMQRFLLPLLLTLLLVACGGEQDRAAPQAPAGQQPAAQQPAPPAEPAPAAPEPVAEAPPAESPAEPAEPPETPAAEPATAAGSDEAAAREWKYPAGRYYSQLTSAQGTMTGPGSIEVTEVFWYGCPHCYRFDPIISRWQADLPADVRFVRLPVMWNPTNEIHARIYYTAEALGKLDEMHSAIFNAIHRDGKTLTRENEIRDLFAEFGVSSDEFDKTFRSFTVESKLKRAKDLTTRYQIRSVPVIIVDGKYIVDGPEVKSFGDMLAVTDELVEKERLLR